ncbi:MAG: hypothetical protein EP344_10200 [Bacteroidetes bacterium]|nr:MAG: hypothetical protein EP344_10200 [Bacteroidota bacterium]
MWKLLSETRSRSLAAFMTGAGIVTLFVLVQSVTGKLVSEDLPFAWGWVAINLMPGLLLLLYAILRHRAPAKLVHPAAHRVLVLGTYGYALMLLMTFLALGLALRQGISVIGYFKNSLNWLLPAQGILLLGYLLAFYRKKEIFRPDESTIAAITRQKAEQWRSKGNLQRYQCFELVATNQLPAAFDTLKAAFAGKKTANHHATITLESQFRTLQTQRNMNTIDRGEAQVLLNRITMGVLNLIEEL